MTTTEDVRPVLNLDNPPSLVVDLTTATKKDVEALIDAFKADMANNPLPPWPPTLNTGWHNIDPELAVNLLRRNRPGANRKVEAQTVLYYASQMLRNDWRPTGQPILLDEDKHLLDAQHRLFAICISGATIRSFVVTDIEKSPNLFAYIDNCRVRGAPAALQTAGFNGVSTVIHRLLVLGESVRVGLFDRSGADKLPRMSPAEVLAAIANYPNAQKAARSAASDWSSAVEFLETRKEVVAYIGMRIIDLYNEEMADDFFDEVTDKTTAREPTDPIAEFHKELKKDRDKAKQMKKQHLLAALIKTFNAWHRGESLGRRWMLQVNEDFPTLDEPELAVAAE